MQVCAFCRIDVSDDPHEDHVPPHGLFAGNENHELIKVPACRKCNNGTAKDDEYFRLLALDFRASEVPAAQKANEVNLRAMFKEKAAGLRRLIFSSLEPVELYSEAGLYLGETFKMRMSMKRLLRTVEKTVGGLYFHLKEQPVPAEYRISCQCINTMNEEGGRVYHEQIAPMLSTLPIRTVGERVFRFQWGFQDTNPDTMFMQLGFYEIFDFIAFVVPPHIKPKQP